jgi:cbb3-type cytochrome oxidase maturation protein
MKVKKDVGLQKYICCRNMSAIFIMIGASLLVAVGFLVAFIWSVKSGQMDDTYTPSIRMLFDSEKTNNNSDRKITNNNK